MHFKHSPAQLLPSVIVGIAILWLTLSPNPVPSAEMLFVGQDKVAHAVMFLVWTLLICRDLRGYGRKPNPWLAALFATAVGALIEVLQWSMDLGRSAEWLDLAADAAGAAIAAAVFPMLTRHRPPHSSPPK